MDITKTITVGFQAVLHAVGVDTNGSPAPLISPVFTVESGDVTLAPGLDADSITVVAGTPSASVVRVDAKSAAGADLVARLYISAIPVPQPEAVGINLTLDTETPKV